MAIAYARRSRDTVAAAHRLHRRLRQFPGWVVVRRPPPRRCITSGSIILPRGEGWRPPHRLRRRTEWP